MKKEVRYYLTEEEVSCVADIRYAHVKLEKMAEKIYAEKNNMKLGDFMLEVANDLSLALTKLEIDD